MATLFEHFLTQSSKNLAAPAYRYLGKETSFSDLRGAVSKLSYLFQHEIGTQARVALLARNSPAWIKTFLALTNIRALVIPINPDEPPSEWLQIFKDTQPTHVAVTSDVLIRVREFMSAERFTLPLIEIEKRQGGEYDTSFTPAPDNRPLETDPILLLRSGGGAHGKHRLAQFNHKQLQAASGFLRGCYKPLSTDRLHTNLSWAHPYSFTHGLLFPLLAGMCNVIDHGLQAVEYLDFLIESRVSRLVGTPPYYLKLLVASKNEKKPIAGIRSATVGLGHLSAELRKVFELLKMKPLHVYGAVENVWTISMEGMEELPSEEPVYGYVGISQRALPGLKYKVMDENGDEIEGSDRRTGAFAVSSPALMSAYFGKDMEKETKNSIRGTWLYTDDIVTLDGEGENLKITLLGRKENLAKVDGDYTPLDELDSVLRHIPGFTDAAGFITKNSKNQTVVACALVKVLAASVNEKSVEDACAQKLPEDLRPKGIVFTDHIPRDAGGNVNYARLRGQFSGAI
jgi:acyl-CoA synthetase (AMP-forming)/AMP-acid ligase II